MYVCAECDGTGWPVRVVQQLEGGGSQTGRAGEGQFHHLQCAVRNQHWHQRLGQQLLPQSPSPGQVSCG